MMRCWFRITCCLLLGIGGVLGAITLAQDTPDEPIPIRFGETVRETLDNLTVQERYRFDGRRGEFITLTLSPISGDLDPVLTLVNSDGDLLALIDDGAERGALLDTFRLPETDVYTITVGRFGYSLGTTRGEYELTLERVGVSSESGSSLRYDDTVINTITDSHPLYYYSFQAQRGDILNVRMQRISGNLDPLVQVVDSRSRVIAASDDVPGSSTLDAAVEAMVINEDGTYVIVATRYGEAAGESTGAFVLLLEETDESGIGNTVQTAADMPIGEPVDGEITAQRFEQFYTFRARENDLINIRMDRISGSLDAYLILLDDALREVTFNDDAGGGKNAEIRAFRVPADGLYYIKATRFQGTEGTTVGQYRLQLDQLGGAFDEIAERAEPLLYGSTVTGVISNDDPTNLYAFYGNQGDAITVAMNRGDGNLDPVVSILGEDLRPLLSDDDSGGGQNARIERFVLGRTGIYYIEAARYNGAEGNSETRGSYVLVLAQRFD